MVPATGTGRAVKPTGFVIERSSLCQTGDLILHLKCSVFKAQQSVNVSFVRLGPKVVSLEPVPR